MFSNCYSLLNVDVSNFIISNKTNMNYMFDGCSDELKDKIKSQNKNIREIAFESENLDDL